MSSKVRAEEGQPSSLIPSLPEDVIVDILARVPRCNYTTLSLVSKHFRSLVASPHIYARRALLGCTEHTLYVHLFNRDKGHQLHILRWKSNGNHCLFHIPSLTMPHGGSFVAMNALWETDEMVNAKKWDDACVVDDVLYYHDVVENKLKAYDSEKKCWGVVNGVEELLSKKRGSGWWETASCGGKLFLVHSQESYIEVTFLRRFPWK
ncbi:unnamed protein product [Microthlaspi erraticum]|uniref:F-box domain-containing protein n=1 Tax=Microthlaspi erraticum TaxID=1685480 RepID=A0A6D2IAE7_9BRAS|nr:unnamed protein product [Microthlaspi erraticum]